MDETCFYVVMEVVKDGNLMEYHNKTVTKGQTFNERDASNAIRQILMALNYMHKEGVIH